MTAQATPLDLLADFLSPEEIAQQANNQTIEEATGFVTSTKKQSAGKPLAASIVPIKIDIANAAILDNDQPLEVATRLGSFTIPLWLSSEVLEEISVRHNEIEKSGTKPDKWTSTIWWQEVRAYLESHGMPLGLTARELMIFWKNFWEVVRGLGKA